MLLTARYIFPVDGPPLPGGVVTIHEDKIAAVEPHGTRTADVDLGNAAVLPGLVNAHTHLDLTGLRGKCPPAPDFTQWLRGVIAHRRSQTPEQIAANIQTGIDESLAAGTTLVGDIAAGGASWEGLVKAQMRSIVFYEVLGVMWERVIGVGKAMAEWLETHPDNQDCRSGLSPHAPYSTHQALFDGAAKLVGSRGTFMATHLAETTAELEFLENRSGPFVDFLNELGAWNLQAWDKTPTAYIRLCRRHTRRLLLAHCNYLSTDALIPPQATIVYCPRTHAAFGHPPHPFRLFLQRGARVALGTDSLASNPDLDLLAEMRFVHRRHPDLLGEVLLRMGTLSGAEALGWADETGSLTPGKSADLVVVPLPDEEGDPYQLLFQSSHPVARTLFRGEWVAANAKRPATP
jgi:cytosine/adenosine deaminase-related metal-dependent hydrolase